ncbi:ParB/RepB/Spo0J family partition protein [Pontivivens ytuae]|uniref:ParB/RepB/Spo0J family partition protein n=1 Tax=Pontivivens ytuae TaxID=2789856 RepID=A0A7S9QEW8_9RHOB|nr:ParB/RepB/Spo0J family partition protein [Pontivivens ytuae]QPH55882.1 ParB/RepB/Spo0J family partition protein [Pontivivens ytuae]
MASKTERKGLGRGLSALLADIDTTETAAEPAGIQTVPIEHLQPNPDQPRRIFTEVDLEDLTRSVREKGVIQPLIVRPAPDGSDGFQIVAGERRWRAAQRAKLHDIPVVIRPLDDSEVLEVAIIENIQRADLNPVEEAQGYRQLMDRFGHTQEKLAEALGKSRSHIANLLRLLTLPDEILLMLSEGKLSAGHARALVPLADPIPLARQIVEKGLSVRQAEQLAKTPRAPSTATPRAAAKDADTRVLEGDLSAALGLKVSINHRRDGTGGQVLLAYSDLDQLDKICQILSSDQ